MKKPFVPDLDQARRNLTLLDEETESFVFQTFDDTPGRKDPALTRVLHGTLEEHAAELTDLNQKGAGVFFAVNRSKGGRRRKVDITHARAVFREADATDLPPLPLEPHFVVETSPGKRHEYIVLEPTEDLDKWDSIMVRMVENYGSDPNAKDRARVLRLAGFFHRKDPSKPHQVRIIHEDGGLPYTLEHVARHIPPAVKTRKAAAPVGEKIAEGARNSYLASLAGTMRRRGVSEDAILAALREENRRRCVPPLGDEEVERVAKSIAKYSPEPLVDEASILAAAEGLTPESPPEDVEPIIKAATRRLKPIARHRLYEAIKEATGLTLGTLRQEAASAFKDAEAEEPDHLDFARKVITHMGDENILCVTGDVWLWEDTGVWRQAQDREIKGQVHQVLEPLADVTKNLVDGVFDLLRTEVFSPRHEWNSDDCLINLANGTLRLSPIGVTLEPHAREHYHNTQIPIEYTPDAPTPEHWQGFLESTWPDDPESIGTLQEIIGLLLTSDTRQQKIFLMVGPKRSGKGTIARLLVKLLGRHNVCGPTLSSLQQNFGIQPLINKTLAVISDARLGSRAEQHVIAERLLAISGEDTLSIPRKYLEDWTGRLATRFLILTNEIPRLADASGALASRFVVLKMSQSFLGREDHGLDQRLAGELPAILNWAIEGLYRLRERGYFLQPASAQEAIEELNDLGSPISAFLREACVVAPGAMVGCRDLYDAWRQWCGEQGRDHPGTLQTFGRDLRAALPEVRTENRRIGTGRRTRFYSGLGLAAGTQWNAVPAIVREGQEHDFEVTI